MGLVVFLYMYDDVPSTNDTYHGGEEMVCRHALQRLINSLALPQMVF